MRRRDPAKEIGSLPPKSDKKYWTAELAATYDETELAGMYLDVVAERDALREFAEAFTSWVDSDAPVEEWDGGSLGYEVGGLYSMATEALGRSE
jgi:hypothetical protein